MVTKTCGPDDVNKDAASPYLCRLSNCEDGWGAILKVVRPGDPDKVHFWGYCGKHVDAMADRLIEQQNFKVVRLGPPVRRVDEEAGVW